MSQITLLDGGMGQELVKRSGATPTALWSTQVMIDHPGLVEAVHSSYFDAGATVATANTYAIHHDRLRRVDLNTRFEDLHRLALDEALRAREKAGRGRVAGAIGPLHSSYRPDQHPPHVEAVALYTEVVRIHAPLADLILCETVASVSHVRSVLEAARTAGLPVWVAVTVDDTDGTRLRSGEPVAEALAAATDGGADAILANCSVAEVMSPALDIFATGELPFGAYANGFTHISEGFLKDAPTVDALVAREDLSPSAYARLARGWVDQGATIVGGCCEVGPSHIAEVRRVLTEAGHRIV